jgi:plasmid stabilization system protein ParE
MAFRVEVAPEAEYDGEAILQWLLSQGAGDAGIRWFVALEDAIASLANFPERCSLVYRILFTIEGDVVHVLHIVHVRRRHY